MGEQKRGFKGFITDVARKPPIIMPLVAVAHVLGLMWIIFHTNAGNIEMQWLQIVWMVAYTASWIAACDLRKWGAFSYIVLTLVNVTLYLTVKNFYDRDFYMSNLFLIDGMFSFFLLFYYKQFS